MTKIRNHKAFTLIELLIFMGIFSILSIVLFQLLLTIFDVELESQSTSTLTQDSRFILNRFFYDISNSSSITSPGVGSTSSTLQFTNSSATYTYSLSGGNLIISSGSNSDQLNSINTSVSSVSFLTRGDTSGKNLKTVTLSVTLKSRILRRGATSSASFQTTVATR